MRFFCESSISSEGLKDILVRGVKGVAVIVLLNC